MTKGHVILSIFGIVIVAYLAFIVWNMSKQNRKREAFEELEPFEEDSKAKGLSTKEIEKNLFIVEKFEETHGRKIKPDEMKELSAVKTNDKKELEEKIKDFKPKESFAEETEEEPFEDDHKKEQFAEELHAIGKQLQEMAATMTQKTPEKKPKEEKKEKFQVEPFYDREKFMWV